MKKFGIAQRNFILISIKYKIKGRVIYEILKGTFITEYYHKYKKRINENKLIKKMYIYIELIKPKKTSFFWLNALAGSIITSALFNNVLDTISAIFAIGFVTYSIYIINDICDEDIDCINKPSRPIPSKRISKTEAKILSIILIIFGFAFVVNLNRITFSMVIAHLVLGLAYSVKPLRLKKGLLANPCMALGTTTSIMCGASTFQLNAQVIFAAISMFFFVCICGYGKDLKDVEGDRRNNIKTLPVIIGEDNTIKLFTLTSTLSFLLFFSGYYLVSYNISYLILLIIATIIYYKNIVVMWKNPHDHVIYEKAFNRLISSSIIILLSFMFGAIKIS